MRFYTAATFILLFITNFSFGQNLILGSVDNSISGVDENKLFSILSNVSDYHGTTPIELRVILTEGDFEKIRGIENRYVATGDLNIQAFDILSEQHLDSKDFVLTGSGSTRAAACKDLVRSIRRKKAKISTWLNEMDLGTVDCAMVEKRARQLMDQSSHVEAYLLANNPGCTEGAYELKEEIMASFQKRSCDIDVRKAETLIAVKKYDEAVAHIIKIDPDSNCGDRLSNLVTQINDNYQADEDRKYQFYLEYYQSEARSREQRENLIHLILLNKLLDD